MAADLPTNVVLVVHGGAGAPDRDKLSPEEEKLFRNDIQQALKVGYEALKSGSSLDAVEAAIKILEDSPRYNAGKGAVFTRDGTNELDASIMEGTNRNAGAVASVSRIKNPISAARAVMEKSEHVLLIGAGAERFAFRNGLTEVSPTYFWTEHRWQEMKRKAEKQERGSKAGTVGAVARDRSGRIAAGTSTGGMNYKMSGRVGDSPIVGAGTYADDKTCGVSGTGHGEVFIRYAVASDVAARMRYKGMSVNAAAAEVFAELPKEEEGVGGIICLDGKGQVAVTFNTTAMIRGYITTDGAISVLMYEK
jgi:beta-aspartyl-peptidase (threonine type)